MVGALVSFLVVLSPVQNIEKMLEEISPRRLRETVEKLASFHTRNTLSPELTKACEWIAEEYRSIPGLQAEIMRYTLPKGRRVPEDKEVVQVIARLPGEDDKIILVGGHIDSLNLREDPMTGRAPGANDDGSGTALALELARVMSKYKWKHTLVFCAFSGEEQGLHGARALAKKAKAEGWKIEAVLNNDTVGSSENLNGQKEPTRVRVFSEESENHQSRELARWMEWLTRDSEFNIKLVFRRDRFGRSGDHVPFNDEGYTAVRFVEVHEEYTRQHTENDLPEHMDFEYLANVARVNLITMASLANAGEQPSDVRMEMRQGHDTTLTWKATPGVKYIVYWRETTSPIWQNVKHVGETNHVTIEKVNKDDHIFAVGAEGGIPILVR